MSLEQCKAVSSLYESVAGFLPNITLMRTFCVADTTEKAVEAALPSIDHFVKSMKAASSFKKSPYFDADRYAALIKERYEFFDGAKFFDSGIIGDATTCKGQLKLIKERLPNVSIALKPVGTDKQNNKQMLRIFNEKIRLNS